MISENRTPKPKSGWLNTLVDYGPLIVFLGVYKFYQPPETSTFGEIAAVIYGTIAFMVAAVADWKARLPAGPKIKKSGSAPPPLELAENPDILAGLARSEQRPGLLIGFAAETQDILDNAKAKRARKGADWIVANDVADNGEGSVMGGDRNRVHILTETGVETLDDMPKQDVARELVRRAAWALEDANG